MIKIIVNYLRDLILPPIRVARLKKRYPLCQFYIGSYVDAGSALGKYNVIFQNAQIINSVLGDYTMVQRNSRILNADIGKFTSISSDVNIGLGRHPYFSHVSAHSAFYSASLTGAKTFSKTDSFSPFQRVSIGHDVCIGQNVLIMDGIKVGNGAVIAMGAVVIQDVPEYAVVSGNPARVFMYRFEKEVIKELLRIQWWNMPDEWLEEHCSLFSDPKNFIEYFNNNSE